MTGTINVVNPASVPAVGTWPLVAFGLLLASAGAVALRRRRL
ncbi:MAG TPA: LPXTG cell wall anchor domain-containing protein [Polyangia bacterium]|nr:LPXTG cell wall anchor domain-containing protein [Polyangia bacterium]